MVELNLNENSLSQKFILYEGKRAMILKKKGDGGRLECVLVTMWPWVVLREWSSLQLNGGPGKHNGKD